MSLKRQVSIIMELLPNSNCLLCEQNTSALNSKNMIRYVQLMESTFFDDQYALKKLQDITATGRLCVLCAHSVAIAYKFKESYESIAKKQCFKMTRTACFLCDSRSVDLVSTDDDPNDFSTKIKPFMGCTVYSRPYSQCVICFECTFCLGIWHKIYINLLEKLNIEDVVTKSVKEAQSIPPADDKAGKQIKEPQTENKSPPTGPSQTFEWYLTKAVLDLSAVNAIDEVEIPRRAVYKSLDLFLKNTQHLKPIKHINKKTKWPKKISNDKKLFQEIPYVQVINNCEQFNMIKKSGTICTSTPKTWTGIMRKDYKTNGRNIGNDVFEKENNNENDQKMVPQKSPIKIRLAKNFVLKSNKK